MEQKPKYVVLEHLMMPDKGLRFWSMNSEFPERLLDGRRAYKVILESDDEDQCKQTVGYGKPPPGYLLDKHIEEMWEKYPDTHGQPPTVMQNLENGLKTSWLWNLEDKWIVLDPDGWDRTNYEFSWDMELITKEEYDQRLFHSTVIQDPKNKQPRKLK